MTAEELKKDILEKTAEYYRLVHKAKQAEPFVPGKSRVNYAGRVFDEREVTNLVDASLEFWLTYGHWSRDFEKGLAYAARLGSDCAFFVSNTPSIATGRGEILNPIGLSLKGYTILLVKPDVSVSTAEAYAGVTPHKPSVSLSEAVMRPVSEWKDCVFNDFEPSVFKKYPLLADIKKRLYDLGAEYAAMTGSGSTIYGIFRTPLDNPADLFPDMFTCQREMA